MLFRSVDELFFRGYRTVKIKQPIFIFANPRSGTTYLHKLMANDGSTVHMNLAHTIFPSVSFVRFYGFISWLDGKTGGPVRWVMRKMENAFFSGWQNIHPLAFNKSEEDEAIYTLTLTSPAIFLFFPYLNSLKENWILDNESEKIKNGMMNYYENSIKRFMYANGKEKIYLCKNVMSVGRINCLLGRFPDAKIVNIARNPYEALPSFISMFTAMYSIHSPHIKKTDPAMQAWAWLGMAFYKHINKVRKNIKENNLCEIKYDDLVATPAATVEFVYSKLELDMSADMKGKLLELQVRNKDYKSKHHYSMEQYGLSKETIYQELKFVFDQFGFRQ